MQQALNIKPGHQPQARARGRGARAVHPANHDAPRMTGASSCTFHGGGLWSAARLKPSCPPPRRWPHALGCPVLSIRYPLWWEERPPADVDRWCPSTRAAQATRRRLHRLDGWSPAAVSRCAAP